MCLTKDEILVNDDDCEDLINVCNVLDLLNDGSTRKNKIVDEFGSNELYKTFNKK